MRLKDTGLTAQELKDMVNKYMVETYERYDFIAESRGHVSDFYGMMKEKCIS